MNTRLHMYEDPLSGTHSIELVDGAIQGIVDIQATTITSELFVEGSVCTIAPNQARLLAVYALNVDRPVSTVIAGDAVWGETADWSMNALRVLLFRLRNSLGTPYDSAESGALRTLPGLGVVAISSANDGVRVHDDTLLTRTGSRLACDTTTRLLTIDGRSIPMTQGEYEFMRLLLTSGPRGIRKQQIQSSLDIPFTDKGTVALKKRLHRLRKKLEDELGVPGTAIILYSYDRAEPYLSLNI